jgi:hypothetical protein
MRKLSDLAIWLGPFLRELRQIMDTAYHAATIAHAYGQSAAIERLATEIQQIEARSPSTPCSCCWPAMATPSVSCSTGGWRRCDCAPASSGAWPGRCRRR